MKGFEAGTGHRQSDAPTGAIIGPSLDQSFAVVSAATLSDSDKVSASALTHLLVVTDPQASRDCM